MNRISSIIKNIIIPLIPMILWGSLFPMIKIGYKAFSIDDKNVGDVIMFAAFRFVICGFILCVWSAVKKEELEVPKLKSVGAIFVMGFFSIVLHYAFTYVGLMYTDSSKTALLKQIGVLFYICFAFLFFKNEKFNMLKIIGAIVGFGGIIAINVTGDKIRFSFGDILIIMASVCTVISSVLSVIVVKKNSPYWVTGISQFGGGLVLLVAAFIMKGNVPVFGWYSSLVFAYICASSIVAYVLWSYLMRTVSLSRLFIIKFAEPLFACVLGALFLGENILKIQYLSAFVLISLGIMLGNKD